MTLRSVANPPNPWRTTHTEWLDAPPTARLEIFEETPRSILSKNNSPDIPFTYSLNPYRGCHHACAYCYAHPRSENDSGRSHHQTQHTQEPPQVRT